jgi:hypothetical protein
MRRHWLTIGLLATAATVHGGDLAFSDPAKVSPNPAGAVGQANRTADLDVRPGFENPPPGFGEVGFYWWLGDKLTKERIQWQLDQMEGKAISGLQINYAHDDKGGRTYGLSFPSDPPLFSEEWWSLSSWFLQAAKKKGMAISLSDYTLGTAGQGSYIDEVLEQNPNMGGATLRNENRDVDGGKAVKLTVPAGAVSVVAFKLDGTAVAAGSGVDLTGQIKDGTLTWEAPAGRWRVISVTPVMHDLSIDPMNPEVGQAVIKTFFQRFEDRNPGEAGKGLNFFFSDELQFGVAGNLWNSRFAAEFKKRKGYDLLPELAAIFTDIGPRTPKIRLDYRDVMVALQEEGYFKPVFDWHQKRGMIYGCDHGGRGGNVVEFGDYFRTQRWNQGPGSDQPHLGKSLVKAKVAASIAHLYDRPRVWLEGFYSSGWQTTSADVADATFANYAMGYNLLTLHGLYYSTRGGYWEWAPPCNHFHMPYWQHMGSFMECMQRLSYVMSQGNHRCDVAVMYPVATKEADMDGDAAVRSAFGAGDALYKNGIDFDFMDFESLERAVVKGKELQVSGEIYKVLVLPAMKAARFSTVQKAVEFQKAGGLVIVLGAAPEASDRAGRGDPELEALVAQLTTRVAKSDDVRDRVAQAFTRDYAGPGMIQHRKIGPRDLYMIYNGPKDAECTFRATGLVELWNPWTGKSKPLPVTAQTAETTTLKMTLTDKEVHLIVFSPGKPVMTAPAMAEPVVTPVSGDWEFELKPALDNRFGDFHWPATPALIGAEARRLEYSESGNPAGPWREVTCGFGPKFWKLGPLPDDFDETQLVGLKQVDPAVPVTSGGKQYRWQPYEFSWRWGKQGDPGHQGYHGLKGNITDEFICLGAPRSGKNETLYGPEPGGNRYYLWTSVPAGKAMPAYPHWGGMEPAGIWVNHQKATGEAALQAGANPVLVRYNKAGRGFFVMSSEKTKAPERNRTEAFTPAAHWIWYPKERVDGDRWFRKTFRLAKAPAEARLRATCDNGYAVSVNGKNVGKGSEWALVQEYDVAPLLRAGENEIVIRASNIGDIAGLIAELVADDVRVATDTSWEVSRTADGPRVAAESQGGFQAGLWYKHPMGPPKVAGGTIAKAGKPVFQDKPLAMTWWKNPAILPFDVYPQEAQRTGLYRFTAPPGFRALTIEAPGKISIQADGKEMVANGAGGFQVATPSPKPVPVLIRVAHERGCYAGEGLPEYLRLDCGPGLMPAGDWAVVDGLKTYSGGAVYRKTLEIPAAQSVVLDLGNVVSTAEVRVNGKSAGVRVTPPWTFDISEQVKPGANRIEVLVYNTLGNHYLTIPTHYSRMTTSGLLGPVSLRVVAPGKPAEAAK